MAIHLTKGDITSFNIDCIVNAANESLTPGGGVCGAIHKVAGPELAQACQKIRHCGIGEARITKGYNLPASYVIHTVGPIWHGGSGGEQDYLLNCYKKSLLLATHHGISTIAFPNISTGIYGYPKQLAAETAIGVVKSHQKSDRRLINVIFCCFDEENYEIYKAIFNNSPISAEILVQK